MAKYLFKKIIFLILSLYILASATFFLMKAVPGDPLTKEKKLPPAVYQNLLHHYGLDKPWYEQYWIYVKNISELNFGISMKTEDMTVNQIIKQSFPYSLKVGLVSVITSIIVGLGFGVIAALRHRGFLDNLSMFLAVIGVSVPSFVLATLLQYFFAVKIRTFHVVGLHTPLDYVLPTIALSALSIAYIARLTRSSMLEIIHADYMKTAKAKGISTLAVTVRHAIRNALIPVVTFVGPLTANVITGSVVIEKIFGIPGIGKYFTDSVFDRDYPVIMGITIFYAMILMVARFFTDIAYAVVDPRIKLTGGKEGA